MPGDRKSIRLKDYDYSQAGGYDVTICTRGHKCIFGDVENGEMVLNDAGKLVEFTWVDLPRHNENIELDEFIVMPNHVHGIIKFVGAGSKPALNRNNTSIYGNGKNEGKIDHKRAGLEPAPTKHGLSEIVRQFKTFSAKRVNEMYKKCGQQLWQRNFYEHVIRNELDLNRVREYIVYNPAKWEEDEYYAQVGYVK